MFCFFEENPVFVFQLKEVVVERGLDERTKVENLPRNQNNLFLFSSFLRSQYRAASEKRVQRDL